MRGSDLAMHGNGKIPVTVLSGFLGSGKTSLLGKALRQGMLRNTAVIVNEFGKIGLDHHLLSRVEERTVLLGGGCVCCSTREDLVAAFLELLHKASHDGRRPDRVVIETTGLADPSPIWFTVLRHPVLQHHFDVGRIVVTVDAVNGLMHLDRHAESIKQAAVADLIVLTKTDIASEAAIRRLESRLRAINPAAEMIRAKPDDPEVSGIFSDRAIRPSSRAALEPYAAVSASPHSGGTRSLSVRFDRPLDWNAFGLWLSMLLHARGVDILRVKGHLDLGGDGPVLLNGVQHIIHPPEHLDAWPNEERCSKIVFIMNEIEPERVMDSLIAFQHVLGAAPERLANAEFEC